MHTIKDKWIKVTALTKLSVNLQRVWIYSINYWQIICCVCAIYIVLLPRKAICFTPSVVYLHVTNDYLRNKHLRWGSTHVGDARILQCSKHGSEVRVEHSERDHPIPLVATSMSCWRPSVTRMFTGLFCPVLSPETSWLCTRNYLYLRTVFVPLRLPVFSCIFILASLTNNVLMMSFMTFLMLFVGH